MLKRLFWVLPLVLALTAVTAAAQERECRRPPNAPHHSPEFDANASGAALALLIGGALLLSERRRRREA